jgi:hypothetical protein
MAVCCCLEYAMSSPCYQEPLYQLDLWIIGSSVLLPNMVCLHILILLSIFWISDLRVVSWWAIVISLFAVAAFVHWWWTEYFGLLTVKEEEELKPT